MHAGALFTLAETASGAAVAGAFADMIGNLRPVAAEAKIAYLKLARGIVSCAAKTSEPAEALRRRLHDEHKVVFDVLVDLFRDDGQPVAAMTVSWNVRFNTPRTDA
jgi:acyl-coenzyme A thioesterase PaaI-like protein